MYQSQHYIKYFTFSPLICTQMGDNFFYFLISEENEAQKF